MIRSYEASFFFDERSHRIKTPITLWWMGVGYFLSIKASSALAWLASVPDA